WLIPSTRRTRSSSTQFMVAVNPPCSITAPQSPPANRPCPVCRLVTARIRQSARARARQLARPALGRLAPWRFAATARAPGCRPGSARHRLQRRCPPPPLQPPECLLPELLLGAAARGWPAAPDVAARAGANQ